MIHLFYIYNYILGKNGHSHYRFAIDFSRLVEHFLSYNPLHPILQIYTLFQTYYCILQTDVFDSE